MRDPHRKHQQLMQELALLNARIRVYESDMRKKKGKISRHEWENLVSQLRTLNHRKRDINDKLKRLKD